MHIKKPTGDNPITCSLIDVIFTHVANKRALEKEVIPLGISDHNLIYIRQKVSLPKELTKSVLTRQYKRCNVNAFHHDLHEALKFYPAASNYPKELRSDLKKNPHYC